MEELVGSLHSLNGRTVGENFRSLNGIIARIKSSGCNAEAINSAVASFTPQNAFEKLIKVRLIDNFRCEQEIFKSIKSGDLFLIPWVLKCSWFFNVPRGGVENDLQFFSELFANISYAMRPRVIKRFSLELKDHKRGELLFDFLKENYGLNTATLVLPSCSEPFVDKVLASSSKYVSSDVFTQLYNHYPDLLTRFVTESFRNNKSFDAYKFEEIVRRIASKDTHLFMTLYESHMKSIRYSKFGKRLAKKVLKTDAQSVITHPEEYFKILKAKHIISMLPIDQVREFHYGLLPSTSSQYFSSFGRYCKVSHSEFLEKVKRNVRECIIRDNLTRAFGAACLTDELDKMSEQLIDMMPPEVRYTWARHKISQFANSGDYSYLVYLPTDQAQARLKEVIKGETESYKREDIVDYMFKNLVMNDTHERVVEVCEFVVKRLRNDSTEVRGSALRNLGDFDFSKLKPDDWAPIVELLNIFSINKEIDSFFNSAINVLAQLAACRMKHGLPADEQLQWMVKLMVYNFKFRIGKGTPIERNCLVWFLENMVNKKFPEERLESDMTISLFKAVSKWNIAHKEQRIQFPDWILDRLIKILISNKYLYERDRILKAVRLQPDITERVFDQLFEAGVWTEVLMYKVYRSPDQVMNSIERVLALILKDCASSHIPFFKRSKLLSNLGLPEKIVEICKRTLLQEDSSWAEKRNSVFVLSMLAPTADYVELILPYLPDKCKVDDYSDAGHNLFDIRKEIAANFKNCINPLLLIDTIKKFAAGDYLKLVIGSMNSVFLKTAQHKVMEIVKGWINCPVSVRKHLIRAYCHVSPVACYLEFLINLFGSEKNLSLRIYMFDYLFKYFKAEPNRRTWAALKTAIGCLTTQDSTSVALTVNNICHVEDDYISDYVEMIWDTISHMEGLEPDHLVGYRTKIMSSLTSSQVKALSEDFCSILLAQFSQDINYSFHSALMNFAAHYLIMSESPEIREQHFKKVMSIIEMVIASGWHSLNITSQPVCPARSLLQTFVTTLVYSSNMAPVDSKASLVMFRSRLLELIDETSLFSELVLLQLRIIFHESDNDFTVFISSVCDVIDDYCRRFGGELVGPICKLLREVADWRPTTVLGVERYLVISELLAKNSKSKYCQLVAINLLSDDVTELENCMDKYKEILSQLSTISEPSVKIYLNRHLKALH